MKLWQNVAAADTKRARRIVNPRRGVIFPVPGLVPQAYFRAKGKMFERYGLGEYSSVMSAEPLWRQCPQVTPLTDKLFKLKQAVEEWGPRLYSMMVAELEPSVQAFAKDSRLGWPHFDRPAFKNEVVDEEWRKFVADRASYENCFTIMNVRLQPEPPGKVRSYQVPDDSGNILEREMTEAERLLPSGALAGRARLVFNKPCLNLALQAVDTVINRWLGKQALCHHDMYGRSWKGRIRPYVLAFDIKHMERFTAAATQMRYSLIRGLYAEGHSFMEDRPYLSPSETWRTFWLLRRPAPGHIVQFGSGHSAVANSQKEVLICLFCKAHVELWGYSPSDVLKHVLSGDTGHLSMLNFGDDNFVSAYRKETLDQLFDWLGTYMDVQKEDPPKFLGFEWNGSSFMLPKESYLLKTWLHERAPFGRFRHYPFMGWVLKRKIFLEYGDASTMAALFEFENRVLAEEGLLWRDIEAAARNEEKEAGDLVSLSNPLLVFGKDYLLTPEEKLATGEFTGWTEGKVRDMFISMTKGGVLEGAL